MRMKSYFFALLVAGFVSAGFTQAWAQETGGASAAQSLLVQGKSAPDAAEEGREGFTPAMSADISDPDVTIVQDNYKGVYSISTLQNLSRLYWRLGAFDFDDRQALSNFLMINECKLYVEYSRDDLEWNQILQVMKKQIESKKDSYSTQYEFTVPVKLGTYSVREGGFPIVDNTGFYDVKRLEMPGASSNGDVCYERDEIPNYPRDVLLIMDKPFSLTFIELDEHVAQAYILRQKQKLESLKDEQKLRRDERYAYIRLRVTFYQYNGTIKGRHLAKNAILYGSIDGYEVFEDPRQQLLMKSVSLRPENEKAALEAAMSR